MMRSFKAQASRLSAALTASILLAGGLLGSGLATAQAVGLTAAPTSTTLPDGQNVPMWGFTCATPATAPSATTATCAATNPKAGGSWSPVIITVPYVAAGTTLTISLTNKLTFVIPGTTNNNIPTSLVIVGQVGGGLGTGGTTSVSPAHPTQSVTWPVAASPSGTNTPTPQPNRVQSFGTEVAAGATTTLTWNNLKPGTYLIESGTHPSIQAPMGLYGILVVTTPAAGTTPAFTYNPCTPTTGQAPCDSYDASVPMLMSEIDPLQNAAVATAVATAGFSETRVWSGQPGMCGNPTAAVGTINTCYPPTVNYSPRYYLIDGVAFDRTNLSASTLAVLAPATGTTTVAPVTGNVMINFVNAGSHMHVPSVVGLPLTLVAEDGNALPGLPRIQNEVFLSAGKTYDVLVKPALTAPTGGVYSASTYPLFDRQLSLSTNNQRDGGMTAYIAVAGGATTGVGTVSSGSTLSGVKTKTFYCAAGIPLSVSDPSLGVLGGTTGANGAALSGVPVLPTGATLSFNSNGTFNYVPPATGACGASFAFTVNGGTTVYPATIAECDQTVKTGACTMGGVPVLANDSYTATNAKFLQVNSPGVLLNDKDPSGLPLGVDGTLGTAGVIGASPGLSVKLNADGSFQATASAAGTYTFQYNVKNEQQTAAAKAATVTVTFPTGSGLKLTLTDDKNPTNSAYNITDYRWVIEEDDTFYTDPACQIATAKTAARPTDSYGRACPAMPVESVGYNFHTANMKVVATGCVGAVSCEQGETVINAAGTHVATVCDIGNGVCRTDGSAQRVALTPDQVYLDPNKHYFISVMPGDAINPTIAGVGGPVTVGGKTRPFSPALDCPAATNYTPGTGQCGHNMGGHQIPPQFDNNHNVVAPAVTISLAETPLPTAQIAVFVYEDDYPLNGENDAGGGVDILAPNEAGLGSFQIELLDQGGQFGDNNGQPTYDMFNMPLSNALAGTIDPSTQMNACPITSNPDGIVGMIVTCPTYEMDGTTKSPLAGQALIKNLYPGLYEVAGVAGADRIARGEEWLQTNTLDGGKPHEAFIRPGEPSFFQEFGPGGFHVQMGFANPKIINDRRTNSAGTGLCDAVTSGGGGLVCNSSLSGQVHGDHMARTPDERTYDTGSYEAFAFSHCYVSIGIPDQQDFAFAKCDANGNFSFTGLPDGVYKMAIFDQWNDIMLDGLIAAVTVSGNTVVQPTVIQWRTNLYTRTYLDLNGNGIPDRDASGNDLEPGLALLSMDVRYRDGSVGFKTSTDANGYASNNEIFPFMNWLVIQPDTTRFKPTGVHVIYDAGGPDDCSTASSSAATAGGYTAKCSKSASHLAGTLEQNSLPAQLRIPGAVYCLNADCSAAGGDPATGILSGTYYNTTSGSSGTIPTGSTYLSSGRIDPPWMVTEGFQGLLGQHSFVDFGMKPYKAATATAPAENGGITGIVAYSSTRPFDDPTLLVQNPWEPLVPNIQINLYQESTNADGFVTRTLVDSTLTSSWDKWAQGFRTDGTGTGTLLAPISSTVTLSATNSVTSTGQIPNMNCPGQDPTSPFFQTLAGSKEWLDSADPVTGQKKTLAYDSQFKCFDGWAMMNQIQPAPYDGKYTFPSTVDRNPTTGRPSGTGSLNGVATPLAGTNCTICIANPDDGNPMLPAGKYVVEVVVPSGWELVKEEDKNILVGDIFIAPVTQQFAGVGNVFILPDQAAMNSFYNANNAQNPTNTLGVINLPRSDFNVNTDQVWPCVGEVRTVPDYLSLFPNDKQVSPFAGAARPLCDRKEVVLSDLMSVNTKFFIYTKNHVAGHFTGMMTNDMASEFDPFSPQFGEKFGAANLPVNMRDFMGTQMSRVYGDQWGVYNGMYFSTWEVNPPNPTGYAPQMSIACMNDPGPILDTNPYLPGGTTANPTYGQMIVDPAYNPAYSNFCYEQMFMPGMTNYMDTPVTPVMAFADHYNLPDAEYPNFTPVIFRADFKSNTVGGIGPWTAGATGVSSVTVSASGAGYTSPPAVSFATTSGTGATAAATMKVTSVTVTAGGTYTAVPTVTFTAAPTGGVTATGTACLGVGSINITNLATATGAYNTTAPTVTIAAPPTGAGSSTATATATLSTTTHRITAVNVIKAGCGYTTAPTVSFTAPLSGTIATATATLKVGGVTITNAGSGYTADPTLTFAPTGATATAYMGVNAVTVTAGGTYTAAPVLNFAAAPTGGTTAAGTAVLGSLTASGPLTLQAVGDMVVQNPEFTGPSGQVAPYNTKSVTRHYGFGTQCSLPLTGCTAPYNLAASSVTVGGLPATISSWSDTSVVVVVPSTLPACPIAQQGVTTAAVCGEVVITAGNGKQSFSGITVTVGGKTPTVVSASSPVTTTFGEFFPNPLQAAIDAAAPGDLLIVNAGSYHENLIMWKPIRLQGVGAAAVTINADAHPAGKMDPWRRRIDCLFGLTLQGAVNPGNTAFDPSQTWTCPSTMFFKADRLPFEGFVGWDASSNGNLAQVLQEPSLMGAYEGAGLTVVGRGIYQPNATDLWGQGGGAGTFINGSLYLTNSPTYCNSAAAATAAAANDYATGNYNCNPSGLDGVTVTNSSQGGGGVYLHGFNNNFQIANNRIIANAGTLSGGINLGNGESPPTYLVDGVTCGAGVAAPAPLCPPIPAGTPTNGAIPSALQTNVHVHHNQIVDNASIGDALFSGSPAGSGGITVSAGSDSYEIDHNWVAGNLTSSDGGGIAQMGVSFNGKIHNNVVLFNEANNPTLSVDGGGIIIMGAQEDRTLLNTGQECGGSTDLDCPPGIGDGTGPGLVIDSNLIMGNSAAYGSGGGLRLRQINGTEVAYFPSTPTQWYGVTVSNNIIANNVAGWDGGGVSLQDAFKVTVVNNTIAANDTTASAGVLFKTLGAINQASPPPGCLPTPDPTQPQAAGCLNPNAPHIPQPAGLVTMQNTPNMQASLTGYISSETGSIVYTGNVTCPAGFGYGDAVDSKTSLTNGRCILVSLPSLVNDMFWENRAFHVEMVNAAGVPLANQGSTTSNGTGLQSQQNIIALLPTFTQTTTGQCLDPTGLTNSDGSKLQLYWDVGVRMDTLPNKNGHSLVFNAASVQSSYSLEGSAMVTGVFAVTGVTVANGGSGYKVGDVVTLTAPPGGTGTGAAAAVATVDANGAILTVTLTTAGSGFNVPPVTNVTSATGTGALLNATLGAGTLTSITVVGTGGAYTTAPTANIDPPATAGGVQATATVTIGAAGTTNAGFITGITLTNKGSGYITLPNVTLTGGGITVAGNSTDVGAVGLTATNSIFSDALNAVNVFGVNNKVPTAPAGGAGLLLGQYCNGARVPPEQCTGQQGATNQGMCLGYFTPAGISENVGVPQVFRFANIAATATVDEGNNWINMTYGPLTLSRPTAAVSATGVTATELMVANQAVALPSGAYSIPGTSAAAGTGTPTGAALTDFFGQTRSTSHPSIGAVEIAAQVPVLTASVGALTYGNVQTGQAVYQTVTLSNTGGGTTPVVWTGLTFSGTNPASWANTPATIAAQAALPGTTTPCTAAGLLPGASCTIQVLFEPLGVIATGGQAQSAILTIASNSSAGSVAVGLTGMAQPPIATITPPATFYGEVNGAASSKTVTIANAGYGPIYVTVPPSTFTGTGFAYTATGTTCAATAPLAVGASCAIGVSFTPTTAGTVTGSVALAQGAYLGVFATGTAPANLQQALAETVTLTGTTVAPTVTITPTSLAFGNVSVGATSATQSITLTNTTPNTISIPLTTTVAVTAPYAAGVYTATPAQGCAALAANTSCTVAVVFKPTVAGGPQGGTVTILSDGTSLGTVATSGTGVMPAINLGANSTAAAPYNFGTSLLGFPITHVFTLSNTGNGSLTIGTIGVAKTGLGLGAYTLLTSGTCKTGAALAANASCTVSVSFSELIGLQTTGTLTVTGVATGTTTPTYTAVQYMTGL